MKINSGVNKNIGNAFYQYFASFTGKIQKMLFLHFILNLDQVIALFANNKLLDIGLS